MKLSTLYRRAAEKVDNDWRDPEQRTWAYACHALSELSEPTRDDQYLKARSLLYATFAEPAVTGGYIWADVDCNHTEQDHNARVLGLLFLAQITK